MNRKQRRVFVARTKGVPQWGPVNSREEGLKITQMAEQAYLEHLRKAGVDTSVFPIINVFVPQFGVTRPSVCLPNEMKPAFIKWMQTEFLPGQGLRRKRDA